MVAVAYSTRTGQDEAGTVEAVIRHAARRFNGAGIRLPHSQLIRRIRRTYREHGYGHAIALVDGFIVATGKRLYAATWAGFEKYTATGYADPTGARAAHNVDRERGSL